MIQFVTPRDEEFGIVEFLETDAKGVADRFSILHYDDLSERSSLPSGCYVFSALDQLTPEALRMVRGVEQQLRQAGPSVRVLNSANQTFGRIGLLDALWAEGLNRHRAVRATDDLTGLTFPVFVREEHRHTGSLSALLRTGPALTEELARSILRGHRLRDLLVVEFCDTADEHGVYRKYAAHVIGTEILPQFMDSGPGWMRKYDLRSITAAQLLEEQDYVLRNPHEGQLRRIFELAGVGYGRIDYAINDGEIRTWEINLNPTIGRHAILPPELDRIRQVKRDHFCRRFKAAFESVDVEGSSHEIPIRHDPEVIIGLKKVLRRNGNRRTSIAFARAVRPIQPWVDRTIRLLSPLILRIGRARL